MELLAVFLPFFGFVIAGLFGKKIGDHACQFTTCFAVLAASLASVNLFFDVAYAGNSYTTLLGSWISSGRFDVSWSLRIDPLSVVMMCVINTVSACVHIYSVGYMNRDDSRGRFTAYLSLLTFAMLMLVTADNLIQLFFGWSGVGAASYLLIGFWNHKESTNEAAVKAFVISRIGDFWFVLGVFAVFVVFGSVQFDDIFAKAPEMAGTYFSLFGFDLHALTAIGLLFFLGAIGKSAQLGLHTWLADATVAPAPVSALIHSATIVTAGVFLIARMSALYEYAPDALMVITIVGACTAFVGASAALMQFDIKRVIAYSTMSQLGYMFFALGVSAYGAAMFHLTTHAFFTALLFLGVGSVTREMSDERDMRKMGALFKHVPLTCGLMWIGSLALAGMPPFSGYYSRVIVLEAAWADDTWFGGFAFWVGILAEFMTSFYIWRLLIMTFQGESHVSQQVKEHINESPIVMLGPLAVLAVGALFAGIVFYQSFVGSVGHTDEHIAVQAFEEFVHNQEQRLYEADVEAEEKLYHDAFSKEIFWGDAIKVRAQNDTVEAAHSAPFWVKNMPLVAGLLGIAFAYCVYVGRSGIADRVQSQFSALHDLMFHKRFFDAFYHAVFVKPLFKIGQAFWYAGDQNTINRLGPHGSAQVTSKLAEMVSRLQSGFVFQYVFVMIIAVVAIMSWFVLRNGQGF